MEEALDLAEEEEMLKGSAENQTKPNCKNLPFQAWLKWSSDQESWKRLFKNYWKLKSNLVLKPKIFLNFRMVHYFNLDHNNTVI